MSGYAGGSIPGALSGAAAGWNTGAGWSKAVGAGDYVTNDVVNPVHHVGAGGFTMSHRELVGNVTVQGDGQFHHQLYEMTPTSSTFSWLNNICKNFEKYRIEGCLFQYEPLCTDEGGGLDRSIGKIVMLHDPDPLKTSFASDYAMQNTKGAVSCAVSKGALAGVECASGETHNSDLYFVPNDNEPSSVRDPLFVTNGNFHIGVNNVRSDAVDSNGDPADVIIGELWVTYTVRFANPKLPRTGE
jgi:hypothetical protein